MKKQILSLATALTALTLNSCLQHESTITLNKDGSGTIVEESRMSAEALAMMQAVEVLEDENEDAQPAETPLENMISKERTEKRAKELGEGVTVVKAELVNVGAQKGARITYRFTDINKVTLVSTEGLNMMYSEMEAEDAADKDESIGFNYKDGVLTLKPNFPEDGMDGLGGDETENKEIGEKELGMMRTMMADMEVSVNLVSASGIAETNATHHDKNSVTLFEIDMNKVMENPDGLKKLMTLDKVDPKQAYTEMNKIDGVKIEAKPEITIKLK
jgi:hypothetical protein